MDGIATPSLPSPARAPLEKGFDRFVARPCLWQLADKRLLEIPVTTMPILKLPIHFSYVHYIASFSLSLARLYFRSSVSMSRVSIVRPSLLLHPLDFADRSDAQVLSFFPAMHTAVNRKLELLSWAFDLLQSCYLVRPMHLYMEDTRESSLRVLRL
jgi:hypothetical protein